MASRVKPKPAIELFEYQKRWLRDQSRFKIGMFARQTGKTWTTTLEIVQRCLYAESQGKRDRWVILSRGERQAFEALNEGVKRHLKVYEAVFKELNFQWEGNYKALEVELPGGSRITALPANPDTARGFSANVFLDEFAFHHDSREIWKAMFPIVSNGWMLRVTSTPNGKLNKFYDLIHDETGTWSKHTVNIHQAVRDGLPRDINELRTALGDADAWAQEYELQWLEEASTWLPFDLIVSCEDSRAGLPEGYAGHPCFLGCDIARSNDLWVAIVVEQIGDVLWIREIVERRRATFEAQDSIINRLMRQYRITRAAIDQTGMGMPIVERWQKEYGAIVEGVNFTNSNKYGLAIKGKRMFEEQRIRIPDRPELRDDLGKLKRSTMQSGLVQFSASRDANGHADRAWALFLALHAAGEGAIDWEGLEVDTTGGSDFDSWVSADDGLASFAGW